MNNNELNKETMQYIVGRLLELAKDAYEESQKEHDPFYEGQNVAFYKMLDVLQTELDVNEQDLKDYGLDIDLFGTVI